MSTNLLFLDAAAQGMGGMSTIIMFGAIFVVMYFFMIRPQQKRQKELTKQRDALQKGDRVVTSGGIFGVVKEAHEATFVIEIADGVRITVDRNSVFVATDTTTK